MIDTKLVFLLIYNNLYLYWWPDTSKAIRN